MMYKTMINSVQTCTHKYIHSGYITDRLRMLGNGLIKSSSFLVFSTYSNCSCLLLGPAPHATHYSQVLQSPTHYHPELTLKMRFHSAISKVTLIIYLGDKSSCPITAASMMLPHQ